MDSKRSKICGETACGFATSSSDVKERSASMRKLCLVAVLCLLFMIIEVVGGIKANSLAILTDAAHLLTDIGAFAISILSLWASSWEANPRQSYGFFRVENLGALVSIQLIWLLTGILVYTAFTRLDQGTSDDVDGFSMFLVASFGLVVNIIMIVVLGHDHAHGHSHGHNHDHGHGHGHIQGHNHSYDRSSYHDHVAQDNHSHDHVQGHSHDHGHDHGHAHGHGENTEKLLKTSKERTQRRNINVQGAYFHVLGDLIQSIGVMIGGGMIWYNPKWKFIDLICTLVFSVIVLATTIKMLRGILEILMESTPREIDASQIHRGLMEIEEVVNVHELHVWAITVGKALLSCHVKIRQEADDGLVLNKVIDYIWKEYRISHVTIQIER